MAKKWEIEFDKKRFLEARKFWTELVPAAMAREDGAGILKTVKKKLETALKVSALLLRDKARSGAASSAAPRRLYSGRPAIFAFLNLEAPAHPKRKGIPIVGVRTGKYRNDSTLYKVWGKGSRRRRDNTVATGGIGMSIGRMFESGTKHIRGKRFWKNAYFSVRGPVFKTLASAYEEAVKAINSLAK